MARTSLPQMLAGLARRIGHDDAVRNARTELELTARLHDDAEDLIRRVAEIAPGSGAPRRSTARRAA